MIVQTKEAFHAIFKANKRRKRLQKKKLLAVLMIQQNDQSFSVEGKRGDTRREKDHALHKMNLLSESEFKLMYRLCREDFNDLLQKITPSYKITEKSIKQGINGSGGMILIAIRLALTLCFLAGASYLDLAFGYDSSGGSLGLILLTRSSSWVFSGTQSGLLKYSSAKSFHCEAVRVALLSSCARRASFDTPPKISSKSKVESGSSAKCMARARRLRETSPAVRTSSTLLASLF